jgi:hypothetical protein
MGNQLLQMVIWFHRLLEPIVKVAALLTTLMDPNLETVPPLKQTHQRQNTKNPDTIRDVCAWASIWLVCYWKSACGLRRC